MSDELMAEAERLMNDPAVPADEETKRFLLDALRERPESVQAFIEQMKKKIAEAREATG